MRVYVYGGSLRGQKKMSTFLESRVTGVSEPLGVGANN